MIPPTGDLLTGHIPTGHILPMGCRLGGIRTTCFPQSSSVHQFQSADLGLLTLEPPGELALPEARVMCDPGATYRLRQIMLPTPDGHFPGSSRFPALTLAVAREAYCLPFGPPLLPGPRQIVTDFLIPWEPAAMAWFAPTGDGAYETKVRMDLTDIQFDIPTALYMDHSISGHYGHFVGDCMPRLHALEVCRALFGDVKIVLANSPNTAFQVHLLNAAGVASRDIVPINFLTRCRRLLMATCALSVEHYASPTSARLWGTIRDGSAVRDITLPDRIYLSRREVQTRRLTNEVAVEDIFRRHGFTIVLPETCSAATQIALMANARLVAGPGGSGLFNLAFQGRLKSAFILAWEGFIQLSEMLFSAGRSCNLYYHIGKTEPQGAAGVWSVHLPQIGDEIADWVRREG